MPKEAGIAGWIRGIIATHVSSGGAAAVSPDFTGTGALTILGAIDVPFKCAIEKLRFRVGAADFAGAGGTQTFKLRKTSAAGAVLATLTITLAAALRGVTLEAAVAAADDEAAKLVDGDDLFLTRDAGGTAFTGGEGVFEIIARQRPQARL